MAKERNQNQIKRVDGKNCFVEALNDSFNIGKVLLNFKEYDESKQKGEKFTKEVSIYIDIDEFLLLSNDILSGKIYKLAEAEKAKGEKYPKEIYADMGGVSSKGIVRQDENRAKKGRKTLTEMYNIPTGKCLSRQFKIFPGLKYPFMLIAECGIGEESDTGLIVPKYGNKPEQKIMIPFSADALKKFVLIIQTHINAYLSSKYILEPTEPTK